MNKAARISLSLAFCMAIGIAAVLAALPGVPPQFWLRRSLERFQTEEIENGLSQFRSKGAAHLTALTSRANYFSGRHEQSFYVGRARTLKFKILVLDIEGGLDKFTLDFFLDYSPIRMRISDDGGASWRYGESIRDSLNINGRKEYLLDLEGFDGRSHDFVYSLEKGDGIGRTRAPGREYLFQPREINVYRIVAWGGDIASDQAEARKEAASTACEGEKTRYFLKDSLVAVKNCLGHSTQGVFFFGGSESKSRPLYYSVGAGQSRVFRLLGSVKPERIFHVSGPFKDAEDWKGKALFPHGDFLAF